MFAAVDCSQVGGPCIIKWTGRKGLRAVSITYCGQEVNAGDGVVQLPDGVKTCLVCKASVAASTPKVDSPDKP